MFYTEAANETAIALKFEEPSNNPVPSQTNSHMREKPISSVLILITNKQLLLENQYQ